MGFFFFFQAEDGIRDIGVTGVQTCALPISTAAVPPRLIGTCPVASGAAGVPERLLGRGREASRLPPTLLHARETTGGWEDGGMPDAAPPVDLASLAAGGNHPGTRSRL